jgi:hypothetical protein
MAVRFAWLTENLAAGGYYQPFRVGKPAYISTKQQKCPEKLSGTLFAYNVHQFINILKLY